MYRFTYENQGSNRFLVYRMEETEKLDRMALGMMNQNKIPHLLPVSYARIDAEQYLRYSGLPQSTLKNLMGDTTRKERFLSILESICEGILSSEEYLLEGNSFVLDEEYIYVDSTGGRASLVYLPILDQGREIQYSRFFGKIIAGMKPDISEDGGYISVILSYINASENFSLEEFARLIRQLRTKPIKFEEKRARGAEGKKPDPIRELKKTEPTQEKQPTSVKTEKEKTAQSAVKNQKRPEPDSAHEKKGEQQKEKADSEEKEGYSFAIPGRIPVKRSGSPETAQQMQNESEEKISMMYLLRNFSGENLRRYKSQKQDKENIKESEKKAVRKEQSETKKREKRGAAKGKGMALVLISQDPQNPKKFIVNKEIYHIGRRENNDMVLGGMRKVSREHCSIIKEKEKYYVIDRNSTFGTIVDGKKCVPGEKSSVLHENSIIELPEISFRVEFR